MAYLRTCVTTTVIDVVRSQKVHERTMRPVLFESVPTPEQIALEGLGRAELWQLVNQHVATEAERVALIERFVLDLPPRTIQARHPALFADVALVYTAIRNLCERLRRSQKFQRLYAEQAPV